MKKVLWPPLAYLNKVEEYEKKLVNVPTSPERNCNIHHDDTAIQPIYLKDIILTSLILMHAYYLFCK